MCLAQSVGAHPCGLSTVGLSKEAEDRNVRLSRFELYPAMMRLSSANDSNQDPKRLNAWQMSTHSSEPDELPIAIDTGSG